jgi:hypothetical protein
MIIFMQITIILSCVISGIFSDFFTGFSAGFDRIRLLFSKKWRKPARGTPEWQGAGAPAPTNDFFIK